MWWLVPRARGSASDRAGGNQGGRTIGAVSDGTLDPGLDARLIALEERVDELSRRLFSDLAPLRPAPAGQTVVDPDVVAMASPGDDLAVARAVLEQVKRTGADLIVAEQAVRAAAGLPPRPGAR